MKIRLAQPDDAPSIAVVHRLAMRVSLPFLPELHTPEEDLAFVRERLSATNTVWVSEVEGVVVGYIAFHEGWIDHLFIHPDHQGAGLGPALLAKALEDGSERKLWTFQKNTRARAFNEAPGVAVEMFTDGEGNEEKEPDVLYVRQA
jgi:GNAT superfamily N-acetyltransferase